MFFKIYILNNFYKKSALKNFAKLRLRPATLLKKTPTQVFSCEICEIFTSANDCFWCSIKKLLWKVSENSLVKIHGGVLFQVRFQLLSLQLYKERTPFCGFFLEFPNIIQRTIFQTCLSDNSNNVDYAHKFSFNKINSSYNSSMLVLRFYLLWTSSKQNRIKICIGSYHAHSMSGFAMVRAFRNGSDWK